MVKLEVTTEQQLSGQRTITARKGPLPVTWKVHNPLPHEDLSDRITDLNKVVFPHE